MDENDQVGELLGGLDRGSLEFDREIVKVLRILHTQIDRQLVVNDIRGQQIAALTQRLEQLERGYGAEHIPRGTDLR